VTSIRIVAIVLCFGVLAADARLKHGRRSPMKHLLCSAKKKATARGGSHALVRSNVLGRESGLWTTTIRTDTEVLTKQKLEYNAKI